MPTDATDFVSVAYEIFTPSALLAGLGRKTLAFVSIRDSEIASEISSFHNWLVSFRGSRRARARNGTACDRIGAIHRSRSAGRGSGGGGVDGGEGEDDGKEGEKGFQLRHFCHAHLGSLVALSFNLSLSLKRHSCDTWRGSDIMAFLSSGSMSSPAGRHHRPAQPAGRCHRLERPQRAARLGRSRHRRPPARRPLMAA
jgi:hypothetical protein